MIRRQHFGKTLIVLATGPLIRGVIALAGIIMRNSVILVDQSTMLYGDRGVAGAPVPPDHTRQPPPGSP